MIRSINNDQIVYLRQGAIAATNRIGEFNIQTLDRTIYFMTQEDAHQCQAQFNSIEEQMRQYFRKIQDTSRDADEAATNFAAGKQAELAPLRTRVSALQEDDNRLNRLIANLQERVTEERVLGTPLAPEQRGVSPNESSGKPDWPQVIQSNVTRIGAVLLTIFLVTILVPQYRYNIRLASFYNARSDSLLFPMQVEFTPDDLSKVVSIMNPNIDFGKAPPTPVEQIVEVIKAVKG